MRSRMLFAALLLLMSTMGVNSAVYARQDLADGQSADVFIEQLLSDSWETRQNATRTLVRIGSPAIPSLVTAVSRPDPELRMRVLDILAQLAVCDQDETRELAQREVTLLAESGNPDVARLATSYVADMGKQLQAAALQKLSSLGAITSVEEYYNEFAGNRGVSLMIGPEWKGTREDLNSIRWLWELTNVTLVGEQIDDSLIRLLAGNEKISNLVIKRAAITNASIRTLVQLPNLQKLQLVYCNIDDGCYDDLALLHRDAETATTKPNVELWFYGTRFSPEAAERLSVEKGIVVDRRNGAFLGVYFAQGNVPCVITRVVGNSAAEKAGIEVGDTMVKFAGRDINIADDFRGAVSNYNPGDKVAAVVLRDGKELELTIVLGEFQDVEQ